MAVTATPCPVTRAEFRDKAQPIEVIIDGKTHILEPKEFSTGSLGWYGNGKVVLKVGDKSVSVQLGLNLTLVNSKEAK